MENQIDQPIAYPSEIQPNQPSETPPINQPLPVQSSLEPSKKNNWKLLVIVLFILVLGMGGFIAYLLQKDKAAPSIASDTTPVVLATPILLPSPPIPSPVVEETANVKTASYKDLSFTYPSTWKVVALNPKFQDFIFLHPPELRDDEEFPAITFYAIDNPENLSVEEYDNKVSKEGMDPGLYSAFIGDEEVIAQKKEINGIQTYLLTDQNCEPLRCDKLSFSYRQKIYVVSNVYDHQTQSSSNTEIANLKNVFNQVIATFKFAK